MDTTEARFDNLFDVDCKPTELKKLTVEIYTEYKPQIKKFIDGLSIGPSLLSYVIAITITMTLNISFVVAMKALTERVPNYSVTVVMILTIYFIINHFLVFRFKNRRQEVIERSEIQKSYVEMAFSLSNSDDLSRADVAFAQEQYKRRGHTERWLLYIHGDAPQYSIIYWI